MDLDKLEIFAKEKYAELKGGSHDWTHIVRVRKNVEVIGEKENANLEILIPAAILHDLGRVSSKEKNHSQDTKLAEELLKKTNYPKENIASITQCIREHSYDGEKKPSTIESKVLFDSDKIDSYGFTGVTRFFMLQGENNNSLEKSIDNAFKRITLIGKASGFYTKTGKKIGQEKAKRAMLFYYSLFKELNENEKVKELENLIKTKFGGMALLKLKFANSKI